MGPDEKNVINIPYIYIYSNGMLQTKFVFTNKGIYNQNNYKNKKTINLLKRKMNNLVKYLQLLSSLLLEIKTRRQLKAKSGYFAFLERK